MTTIFFLNAFPNNGVRVLRVSTLCMITRPCRHFSVCVCMCVVWGIRYRVYFENLLFEFLPRQLLKVSWFLLMTRLLSIIKLEVRHMYLRYRYIIIIFLCTSFIIAESNDNYRSCLSIWNYTIIILHSGNIKSILDMCKICQYLHKI